MKNRKKIVKNRCSVYRILCCRKFIFYFFLVRQMIGEQLKKKSDYNTGETCNGTYDSIHVILKHTYPHKKKSLEGSTRRGSFINYMITSVP